MDWETLYCPNRYCRYYGLPGHAGRLVKNGSTRGQKQALCKACGCSVALRYGTAYFDLNAEPLIFETAVRALAEGNSLRSTARIVAVDKDTACDWLNRAAQHCRLVMLYFWRNLHVTECQLDELWSFIHTKEKNLEAAEYFCISYGDAWVWIAFAPVWRLVLAFVIGKRNQANADLLLQRLLYVTDKTIPFFTSDQLPEYRTALLKAYGSWEQPARQGDRGRWPKPRLVPQADLLYAQVVKRRENGRLVEVTTRIVFGQPEEIALRLSHSPVSTLINTSFVERDNLTLRQHNRRLTRKTNGFSKELSWFEKQLWLALAYYHLVLPHQSLRQKLTLPEATRGTGSARCWQLLTPAMAAGLTDHIWTMTELLSFRLPVQFIETLKRIDHLFPSLDLVHQGS
jgi:IS1 family transposase